MSKFRIKYICTNCGYESLKWLGKCPSCEEWNTFSEEVVSTKKVIQPARKSSAACKLNEIPNSNEERLLTNISEFDRVLGGGFVAGSVVLIGGDPGIGKSTLVMQAASTFNSKSLYVTGEESLLQINTRAKRLNINPENFYVLAETNTQTINETINELNPKLVIIDSIQTMFTPQFDNAPGSVTQIREAAADLMKQTKANGYILVLIGHVTKDGMIAGPKVLEHIVDTVLQFEGERNYAYRILRGQKNRFGSTNEIGIFAMHDSGLQEVLNPSQIFIGERSENNSGSVITSSMEGSRPVLLEVQALVTPSNFGNPQRVATGFDYRRLSILLAVLEKRASFRLSAHNVFLNMAGGLRIDEPAVDLAVCCSIASSLTNKSANENMVVFGEVGLGGEIRSVSHIEKRILEAEKLGFETVIIPKNNFDSLKNKSGIKIIPVSNLADAIKELLV